MEQTSVDYREKPKKIALFSLGVLVYRHSSKKVVHNHSQRYCDRIPGIQNRLHRDPKENQMGWEWLNGAMQVAKVKFIILGLPPPAEQWYRTLGVGKTEKVSSRLHKGCFIDLLEEKNNWTSPLCFTALSSYLHIKEETIVPPHAILFNFSFGKSWCFILLCE